MRRSFLSAPLAVELYTVTIYMVFETTSTTILGTGVMYPTRAPPANSRNDPSSSSTISKRDPTISECAYGKDPIVWEANPEQHLEDAQKET